MTDDTDLPSGGKPSRGIPFGMVETSVMRDRSLPLHTKAVYAYLTTYCGTTRSVWPSRATIAADLGMSPRAVSTAIKAGDVAGLWDIEKRHNPEHGGQTSNLCHLRDFGHGYVTPVHTVQGVPEQRVPGAVARDANEEDNGSRPFTDQTSGDTAVGAASPSAGLGHRFAPTDRDLMLGRRWDQLVDRGKCAQYLVGAAIRTMERVGLVVAPNAGDQMGAVLKGDCKTKADMLSSVQAWVNNAGTDDPNGGHIAWWPAERKAS